MPCNASTKLRGNPAASGRRASIPLLAIALLLGLTACDVLGVSSRDVEGDWLYSAADLEGDGWRCAIEGMSLTLVQDGRNFHGSTTGGLMTCFGAAGPTQLPVGTLPVLRGRAFGDSIRFEIGSSTWENRGVRTGRSISGETSLRPANLGGVTITGSFGAARALDD